MGLIDWLSRLLGGGTDQNPPAEFWIDQDAKMSGVARRLNQLEDSVAVLLVAHFEDVKKQLEEVTRQYEGPLLVLPVLADQLSMEMASQLNVDPSATIDVWVAEAHPVPEPDQHIKDFADRFPCHCRLCYHLALTDPLLVHMAGTQLQKLAGMLDLDEEDSISSRMLDRRVWAAQQSVAKSASGRQPADSARQWLQRNAANNGAAR